MEKEEIYIDFLTNNYSLALLLLALEQSSIRDFAIIREDDNLHIRIPKSHLERIVYYHKEYDNEDSDCMPQKEKEYVD